MAEIVAKYVPNEQARDLVLWADPKKSGGVFAGITVGYYMLEKSGYTVLALSANVSLFLVVVSFLWANVATLIGRGPPPIPDVQLSEATARSIAENSVSIVNNFLKFGHTVLTGSNIMTSVKSAGILYVVAKIGGWFNLLTFFYMGAFFAFVFPKVYIMKQKEIDDVAAVAFEHIKTYYNTIEQAVLSKIPKAKGE